MKKIREGRRLPNQVFYVCSCFLIMKALYKKENILDLLDCDAYYYQDIWIFFETDLLRQYCYDDGAYRKKRKLDFSYMKSNGIKSEFKFWIISLINQGRGASQLTHKYSELLVLIDYFSLPKFKSVDSVLLQDFENAVSRYKMYLASTGRRTTKKSKRIDKKLEYRYYDVDSTYVCTFKLFYAFINSYLVESKKNIFDRDTWVYTELPFPLDIPPSSANRSTSFKKIQQPWLKYITKKICWYYFEFVNAGTGREYCYNITTFSKFLSKTYPEIKTEKELTGEIIKRYYEYIKVSFNGTTKTKQTRVQAVETILTMIKRYKWSTLDESCYFVNRPKFTHRLTSVDPYTDAEMREINNHLSELPIQIARLICVIQYLGCRPSEICSFEIKNFLTNSDGTKYIYYRQFKTKKPNIIPLNDICCEIITAAIETTRRYHGEKAKYIFSTEKHPIISPDNILYKLKVVSKNGQLEDKEGKPLNILLKRFRAVVATQYADLGINPQAIMKMLGQSSLGILSSYIDINNETYLTAISPVLKEQGEMIRNIGKSHVVNYNQVSQELIPLPNGLCEKSPQEGVCKHANTCYQCKLFVPDKRYLNVYKYHQSQARLNIDIARENGYERLQQMNESLFESLSKIISKLEEKDE